MKTLTIILYVEKDENIPADLTEIKRKISSDIVQQKPVSNHGKTYSGSQYAVELNDDYNRQFGTKLTNGTYSYIEIEREGADKCHIAANILHSPALSIAVGKNLTWRGSIDDLATMIKGEHERKQASTNEAEIQRLTEENPGQHAPILSSDYPVEQFQKIQRSILKPELLRLLQERAWFTAGNPAVNVDEQIEKEFFICGDEMDYIISELEEATGPDTEEIEQARRMKSLHVSYFHIIDQ